MLIRPPMPFSFATRYAVDDVKVQFLLDDLLLDGARQMLPDFVRTEGAVQQEHRAGLGQMQHVHSLQEGELMARDEAGLLDQVAGADRLAAEAQVRNGHRAGLLRVVHEIALRVIVRVLADDLDRVLVRADRAVGAQTVEDGAHGGRIFRCKRRIHVQAAMRNVVVDADDEMIARLGRCRARRIRTPPWPA